MGTLNGILTQVVGYYHEEKKAKTGDASDAVVCGRIISVTKQDDKSFQMTFSEGEPMVVRADTAQDAQRWIAKIEARTGFSDAKSEEMPSPEEIDRELKEMLEAIGQQKGIDKVLGLGVAEKWEMLKGHRQQRAQKQAERDMGDHHNDPEEWIRIVNVEPSAQKLEGLRVMLRTQPIQWVTDFIM